MTPATPTTTTTACPTASENDVSCPYRLVGNSDGDTVLDGYEVAIGYRPLHARQQARRGRAPETATAMASQTGWSEPATTPAPSPETPRRATPPARTQPTATATAARTGSRSSTSTVTATRISSTWCWFAKRAFNIIPASDSDYVLDINKNGTVNIFDVMLAARNSTLLKPHSACPLVGVS